MVFSREVWDLRDGTPPNKEKPFQTRKRLSKQGKGFPNKGKAFQTRERLSSKGKPFKQEKYLPKQEKHLSSKETSFKQAGGIFHSNIEVYKW